MGYGARVRWRRRSVGVRDLLAAKPDELRELDAHLWGSLCLLRPEPAGLLPIPGQLSTKEGRMLFRLLAEVWDGSGNVVELGTLFGASTQAIGLGMATNPARQGRLFSADAFGVYFPAEDMVAQLEPLLGGHPDWPEIAADFRERGFERAFAALHSSGRPYSAFLTVTRCLIPLRPGDSPGALRKLLDDAAPVGVAFVDSVKHWYGVRALVLELVPRLARNALVAWQDERWFNAYAICFFNERLAPWFEPLAIGDGMHIYRYRGGASLAELESVLPATAADAGAPELERVFGEVAWRSYLANDAYGVLSATLQLSFALAEVGRAGAAEELVQAARSIPGFLRHDEQFRSAEGEFAQLVGPPAQDNLTRN